MKYSNLSEQEIIAKVKREFKDYKFYNKLKIGWTLRIDELETRINKTGGSFPKIPDGSITQNIHKNSPLFDEIEELKRRISLNEVHLEPIERFKLTLNDEEIFILNKKYFDKELWTYEKLAMFLYKGERTIKRDVDKICLDYWHSGHDI